MKRFLAATVILLSGATLFGATHRPAHSVDEIHRLIDESEPGATILVPAGVYEGNLVVRKSVTLDGQGHAIIDGLGEGTVVLILAADSGFRRFTVRGSGEGVDREPAGIRAETGPIIIEHNIIEDTLFGIDIRESPDSIIRHNTVRGKDLEHGRRGDAIRTWWSHGAQVVDNTVTDARDIVLWYSSDMTIARNTISRSRYGLHFMYSHDTIVEQNLLNGNSVGIYLMYSNGITVRDNVMNNNRGASGYGLGLKDCDDIRIERNGFMSNRVGVYIDNSPSSLDSTGVFHGNLLAYNETGVLATPNTHDNVFTDNAFLENEEQVGVHGRGTLHANAFAKDGHGNFWSDYAGFDRDGDGIGDLPYESQSLFESLIAREPNLRFFVHSPAQQAVEFTSRALPELRPEPKFSDPSPLTDRPEFSFAVATPGGSDRGMLLVALLLSGGAAALTWLVSRDGSLARLSLSRKDQS